MTRALVLIVVVLSSILLPLRPDGLDRAHADVSYIYDALGRLVAVVDSASNEVAIYRYDAVGNLTAIERQSASVVSIIEFNPKSGPVGTTVTIYGTGFSATASQNTVGFNGTAATVTSATSTQIVASVPAGATTGPITVTAPGGSATSSSPFIVGTPGAPTITSFTPTIGTPSTPVAIAGTNFDTAHANNRVRFNSVAYAPVSSATATTISGTVPSGTGSGRISVTTPAGSAVSSGDFFIPPAPNTAADVEVTGRMSILGGSQSVTFSSPNKIGLIVFDATAGQLATLRITGVTIAGSTLVAVDNPNGTLLTSTYVTTSGGNLNLTLPVAGTYTVRVDPSSANTGTLTLIFGTTDLNATAFTAPSPARVGEAISLSWTVTNQGTGATQGSWVDYVYLSADQTCCAGDTLFVAVSKTSLAAGASYTETRTVTIPNTPAGNYYLILKSDVANGLFESDETNNNRIVPIAITTSDLTPTALTAPGSATTQQSVSVSWTVLNQGTGTTQGAWVDYVYLSTDQSCCAGDTIFTSVSKTTLAAGATYTETRTVTVPNVAAGSYYLILRVDHAGGVYEADEANNQRIVPITITNPDLAPTSFTGPATVVTQQSISVSWTVANQGTGTALPLWGDYVFLSTDQTCCTGDVFLTNVFRSGVAAGTSYTETKTATVPSVPAGNYYLIFRADHFGNVYESDEANNQGAAAITVTAPDLTPISLTAPASAAPQQAISISWTVTNQGTGATQPSWFDSVYFSTDQVCCSGDTILIGLLKSALAAGGSYTETRTVTLPNVAAGNYYLILKSDSIGSLYEGNEANNERVVPITIAP